MPKTVVIADDHAFATQGLMAALEQDGRCKVVGCTTNGIEAIALIKTHAPDCAVVDLAMPGATGIEVLLESRRWSPQTRILVLTGTDSGPTLQSVQKAGAHGIFVKSTDPLLICQGIYDVACGLESYDQAVQHMLKDVQQAKTLTPREREVLIGLSKGLSNQGISERLGVSPKTVDSHRTSLMRKMGVNSTATLLVKAMRDGLF
ncbi:MAG: response regulator [Paracoccaceae bacterium]